MALSSDDVEPQVEIQIQPDTRLSQMDEINEQYQYKYHEEQTTLDHTSKESQSHDKMKSSNYVVETPSKMYVVEKEAITVARIKSTIVIQTFGAEIQPTEKLSERKTCQHEQLLKGTINTEESKSISRIKVSQPENENGKGKWKWKREMVVTELVRYARPGYQ